MTTPNEPQPPTTQPAPITAEQAISLATAQHEESTLAIQGKASNPARNGRTGRIGVYLTFGGLGLFGLFLLLDTVQYAITGHESAIFIAIARGVGGLGIGSLLVTLYKSYFVKD